LSRICRVWHRGAVDDHVEGRLAIRAAIVSHRTRAADIDTLLAAVVAIGERRG
jgi:hypothetical protein